MGPLTICISVATLQMSSGLADELHGIMSGSYLEIIGLVGLIVGIKAILPIMKVGVGIITVTWHTGRLLLIPI
jgi:hypothetical protein